MKKMFFFALLSLSLALNAAVLGTMGFHWMHARAFSHGRHHGPDVKFFKKQLNLTPEQTRFLQQDRTAMENEGALLREQLRTRRREVISLMKTETNFTPKVEQTIDEVAHLQAELEKTFVRHSFAFKQTLSPEQQKKFTDLMEKGMNRMRKRGDLSRPPEGAPEK